MIWHFLEVWALILAAFAAGCVLGTLLYMALAASPMARMQVAAAEAVGGTLGGLRGRAGMSRDLSSGYRRPASSRHLDRPPAPVSAASAAIREAEWPPATDPVAAAIEGIDEAIEPREADWEGEAYWAEAEADLPTPAEKAAAPVPAPLPILAPQPVPEPRPDLPSMRPLTLPGPRNGVPDNLQRIRGIGQKNEELLNGLGIFHFGQIAAWTPAEARWVANHLAFPERIERDDWVGQAIILATGGNTGYVKAAERRRNAEDEPPAAAVES